MSITGKNDFQSNGRHNPKRNLVGKEIWRRKGQQESSKQGEDKGKKGQGVHENIENIQIQPVGNGWLDMSAVGKMRKLISASEMVEIFKKKNIENM